MAVPTQKLLEEWKKKLLDLSKRNSLMNYRATKRGSLQIVYPDYKDLFSDLLDEKPFSFAKPSEEELFEEFDPKKSGKWSFNIKSSKEDLAEEISTLRSLRRKAKTIIEEQGINVLHLTFGQLKWKETENSSEIFTSPLVLVPVSLNLESVVSPFVLELQDDDVTVNPTLKYKLEHDFNLVLPEFEQEDGIEAFLNKCRALISEQPGWEIENSVYLSTFSYLKINMYNDLSCNESDVCENPIVKALAGDLSALPNSKADIEEVSNLNFDKDINPQNVYQVLDADSSQQEAIELAKRGVSYVLQGPPGTGKSQTITNIIAECLANGKKVLFVSEKEAALDVVKNRLTQTGIVDFCLALHSHKANKKEIVNELYRTASLPKKRFKEENLAKLDKLYENRNKLNDISDELHREIKPLSQSVFSINGELSALESYKDIVFDYSSIDAVDQPTLSRIFDEITLLSKAVGSFNGDRFSPLWSDCSLSLLSNQNKNDFHAKITPDLISQLTKISTIVHSVVGQELTVSWNSTDNFIKLLEFCSNGSPIPESWKNANLDELRTIANKWALAKEDVSQTAEIVASTFDKNVTSFDAGDLKANLDGLVSFLDESTTLRIEHVASDGFFNSLKILSDKISVASNYIDSLIELDDEYEALKLKIDGRKLSEISLIRDLFVILPSINHINQSWFELNALPNIRKLISDSLETFKKNDSIRSELLTRFDDSVFSVDVNSLLPKFRAEYNTVFRFFKSSYRKDLNQIRGHEKSGSLKYAEARDTLTKLKKLQDNQNTLQSYSADYQRYFGFSHALSPSDFDIFTEQCTKLEKVNEYYSNFIPSSVQRFILDGKPDCQTFKESINVLNSLTTNTAEISIASSFSKTSLDASISRVKANVLAAEEFTSRIDNGISILKSFEKIPLLNLSKLNNLVKWEAYLNNLKLESKALNQAFEFMYKEESTDWRFILSQLQWLSDYRVYEKELNLPVNFTNDVTSKTEVIEECLKSAKEISNAKRNIKENFEWFGKWFTSDSQFLDIDLSRSLAITQFYYDNLENLDEWISIKRATRGCERYGLQSFITNVVNKSDIPCEDYLGIFKKRFYSMWLDKFQPSLPTISGMSKVELDTLIDNFKAQDTDQFIFAKLRIYQILSEQLPNVDITCGANDQLGILRREYNKRRRQLPLRKLFNQIPTLVQQVKPCMMMSPLSVSLFLQNKDYRFDVVVFDEASQVKPENAIGSIIRGAQLIVAGDTHQLPPTSFFEKSTNDEDLYDNEVEETESFAVEESILDAAANILPERYLKWHYRSRHEHLIAFSNAKIYDSRLTTFPSAIDKLKDHGVEFEFVSNGVYDRSAKRNNPEEAKRVADLVFDHFKNHPDRSLGVISNSEAQARAIEDLILKMRTQKQSYESFFNEERKEPFFIKSLESVQGDERDTIIFSIGYGKDANGKMYNSFGPINLDGGERRLNVAVTRAKHNLKLVSSINAEDIAITENSKQGPRLLKAYIDYAKRGIEAITGEISDGHALSFDSPFEESVYGFLTEKGYQVETQVGCAGYRIDLGVKDPDMPGRYILAVECDGATYHSSKYARERDRLRQNVLENIGWHFYRVWSTEWIKHTAQEKSRLLNALADALHHQNNYIPESGFSSCIKSESLLTEAVVDEIGGDLFSDGYQYEAYHESDQNVWNYRMSYERVDKILEAEAPMHIDYLCQKMAPHLGRQKVTSVVKESVNNDLNGYLKKKYKVENGFIYKLPKAEEYRMRDVAGRDIAFISPEELKDLMMQVVDKTVGISPDDLANQTGHVLGYAHCKERIMTILKNVFESLVSDGKLDISPSGTVIVKKKQKNINATNSPIVEAADAERPLVTSTGRLLFDNSPVQNDYVSINQPASVVNKEVKNHQRSLIMDLSQSVSGRGVLALYEGMIIILGCLENAMSRSNSDKLPFDYISNCIERKFSSAKTENMTKKLGVARDMISLLASTDNVSSTVSELEKKYK